MPAQPLKLSESSWITGATYDAETRELVVLTRTGARYSHPLVEENTAQQFAVSDSPGRFYANQIKGRY